MKRRSIWWITFFGAAAFIALLWLLASEFRVFSSPNQIGVIEIRGLIDSSQETLKAIKTFRKDPDVKAILVRIESPGGGVGASQEIYRELKRTTASKPVVASLGGLAASGGYYIAVGTGHIVANPGTITGSIGVITYFPNLKDLFEKIGYATVVIKSGPFKDIGNPDRDMTPEEKALLQGTIDEAYGQFVKDVSAARNLPEEKVREVADGRILMGQTAYQLGLVDELGNFEDAVNAAAKLGKISGEPELTYAKKKSRSLLDFLLGSEVSEQLHLVFSSSAGFLRYQLPFAP